MRKFLTFLRASMSDGMSLFRIKVRGGGKLKKVLLFGFLIIAVFVSIYGYADMMLEPLAGTGMEYSVLTIYSLVAVLFIVMEGLYKSSELLFNCRDDNLVLALPVRRSTVLLVRMMKFYLFELAFTMIILLPTMAAYVVRVGVSMVPGTFYLASLVALILLPVVPVVISALAGIGISEISTRFRFKRLVQTVLVVILLLGVLALSFNIQNVMMTIAEHASSINDAIMRLYYPVGAYIQMVTDFSIPTLLIFIVANLAVAMGFVWLFAKIYFRLNSRMKITRSSKVHKKGKIRSHGITKALMIKEGRKFVSSPVFLTNAGFSLVIYLVAVVMAVVKFDSFASIMSSVGIQATENEIVGLMPVIVTGFVVFCAMMTSITSSMISLEGRTINILKSLPVSAFRIVMTKVLVAVLIAAPVFLVGDVLLFIKFDFDIWQMLMILVLSVVMPVLAEVFGIVVNLKFPKMDAENDAEVVKQSMSATVAVLGGIIFATTIVYIIYMCIQGGVSTNLTMAIVLAICTIIMTGLIVYLKVNGEKDFSAISA